MRSYGKYAWSTAVPLMSASPSLSRTMKQALYSSTVQGGGKRGELRVPPLIPPEQRRGWPPHEQCRALEIVAHAF